MKIESDGILIGLRPFGERDIVATVFSRGFGVVSGLMRGGAIKKSGRALVGQVGHFIWMARLDSQLGALHWDPDTNLSIRFMNNSMSLKYFNSVLDLIRNLLPEREVYDDLYDYTLNLLYNNVIDDEIYLDWEMRFLRELGYAIDLSHCSGCGVTDNLHYMSPKTCRAVCDKCAEPYVAKLYRLPVTLDTTYRLLENACTQLGVQMPKMRNLLKNIF